MNISGILFRRRCIMLLLCCFSIFCIEQLVAQTPLSNLGEIPKIFTPNGDGFNDMWEISGIDQYPEASIRIYNRSKKLMVEFKGAQMPWNGRDHSGKILESGNYLYEIVLRKDGRVISGFVTVLK